MLRAPRLRLNPSVKYEWNSATAPGDVVYTLKEKGAPMPPRGRPVIHIGDRSVEVYVEVEGSPEHGEEVYGHVAVSLSPYFGHEPEADFMLAALRPYWAEFRPYGAGPKYGSRFSSWSVEYSAANPGGKPAFRVPVTGDSASEVKRNALEIVGRLESADSAARFYMSQSPGTTINSESVAHVVDDELHGRGRALRPLGFDHRRVV
jgi:hypothetical protein